MTSLTVFANYADAAIAAGELVREIIEACMPELKPNKEGTP
jgi:hypothetical protein